MFDYGDDLPPVPVINDADDFDVIDDVDAVMAALDDEEPTEQQVSFQKAGGVIFTPSDRTDSGGIPLGQPPELLTGQQVRMDPLGRTSGGPSVRFVLDGRDDPIVREVLKRHQLKPGEVRGRDEYLKTYEAVMTEIAAEKRKQVAPESPALRKAAARAAAPVVEDVAPRTAVDVTFDFGGVDGKRRARYRDVYIENDLLVLVAGTADLYTGVFEPPNLGPNRPIVVTVQGLDAPVRALSCGLTHTYGDSTFFLLFVDRGND